MSVDVMTSLAGGIVGIECELMVEEDFLVMGFEAWYCYIQPLGSEQLYEGVMVQRCTYDIKPLR